MRFQPHVIAMLFLLGLFASCSSDSKKMVTSDLLDDTGDIVADIDFDGSDGTTEDLTLDSAEVEDTADLAEEVDSTPEVSLTVCVLTTQGCLDGESLALNLADHDTDPEAPGLQVDFQVSTIGLPAGSTITLSQGGELLREKNLAGTSLAFEGVTIAHSIAPDCPLFEIRSDVDATAVDSVTICADTGGCAPILEPTADSCLGVDEDPNVDGIQVTFTVATDVDGCDFAWLEGDVQAPMTPLEDGKATFLVTVAGDEAVCQSLSVVAYATDPQAEGRQESVERLYTVDSGAPVVTITSPISNVVNLNQDEDGDPSNGLQVTISGEVSGVQAGTDVEFVVDDQLIETAELGAGPFSFQYTFEETGGVAIAVRTTDCCENTGEATLTLLGILDNTETRILYPTNGTVLLAKNNGPEGTSSVFTMNFEIMAPVPEAGETINIRCRRDQPSSPFATVGFLLIDTPTEDGLYTIPVSLNVNTLTHFLICRGAYGTPTTTTPEIGLTLAIPAPYLIIEDPGEGDSVNPASFQVAGGAFMLAGQEVTFSLLSGDSIIDELVIIPGESGFFVEHPLTAVPDGTYTLKATASDQFGNDIADNPLTEDEVSITIDGTTPSLAFLNPTEGFVCTPPGCADTIAVLDGHQIESQVELFGESNLTATAVCLQTNGGSRSCTIATMQGASAVATFFGITLLPGTNTLVALAEDGVGQESDPVSIEVTLNVDAPRIEWVNPAKDLITPIEPVTITGRVKNPVDGTLLDDATVTLKVQGIEVETQSTGVAGEYDFVLSGLAPNQPTIVQLSATHPTLSLQGFSDIRRITLKDNAPLVEIVTPADNTVFNLANTSCLTGVPGCRTQVTAQTTNVEDESPATLTANCGGTVLTYNAEVSGGTALFPAVNLPDNNQCALTVTVMDLAGQSATSAPTDVTVDRTPPHVCSFSGYVPNLLPVGLDEDPAEGYQYSIEVLASSLKVGDTLVLTIDDMAGTTEELTINVDANVPDNQCKTLTFPQFTFQEASYNLTATATDAAGNQDEFSKTVQFFLTTEAVRIDSASYVPDKVCSSTDECGIGVCTDVSGVRRCVTPWSDAARIISVYSAPFALFDGEDNIRLCSDAPGLTGGICSYSAEGTFRIIKTLSTNGGPASLELTKAEVNALPQGIHKIFVEARRSDNNQWLSSMESGIQTARYRTVLVDTVPPVLSDIVFSSDSLPPSGTLNAAEEDAAISGRFSFAFLVQATVDGSVDVTVDGVNAGSFPFLGSLMETPLDLPEGLVEICGYAHDIVGNPAAEYCESVIVDTVLPTLSFVKPTTSPLLANSSPDVQLTSSEANSTVALDRFLSSTWVLLSEQQADNAGSALFTGALNSDGQYTLRASVSDDAGNIRERATTPATILVDRTAPEVSDLVPASGTIFNQTDDADAVLGGFQLDLAFTATGADSVTVQTQRCDATWTNCEEAINKPLVSGGFVSTTQFEGRITITNLVSDVEYRRLLVEVRDVNGNKTTVEAQLQFVTGTCTVTLFGLSDSGFINNEYCPTPGTDCDTATVNVGAVPVGNCTSGDTIVLTVDGTESGTTTDLSGSATQFTFDISHGATAAVEARLLVGTTETGITSGEVALQADLQDPVISWVEPATTTFICNLQVDQTDALEGCQFDASVNVIDDQLNGGNISLRTRVGGTDNVLASLVATSNDYDAVFNGATADHGVTGLLVARSFDMAGNMAEATRELEVDIVPPSAVALNAIDPETDVNRRRPEVRLTWTAVGDDGETDGAVSHYVVRYSQTPITEGNFNSACDPEELASTGPPPVPGEPAGLESYDINGPDFRAPSACRFIMQADNQTFYYFAVRAVDDVGNESPIEAGTVVSTNELQLRYTKIDRGTSPALVLGQYVFDIGDIDGDGYSEAVLGGDGNVGGFCIVRGLAAPESVIDISTASTDRVRCYTESYFNREGFVMSSLGDVNGDGYLDLGSRAYLDASSALFDEFRVYLGNADGFVDDTPALVIHVDVDGTFHANSLIAFAGNFNGDSTVGGAPLFDIVVSVPEERRVYVIPGTTALDSTAPAQLLLSDSAQLDAWNAIIIDGLVPTTMHFGKTTRGVGNVLLDNGGTGPQFDDLAIGKRSAAFGNTQDNGAVFVVKGRAITGATILSISDALDGTGSEDSTTVKLLPDTAFSQVPYFAEGIYGANDVDGDGTLDVLVTHLNFGSQSSSQSYVYYGATMNLPGAGGSVVRLDAVPQTGGAIALSDDGLRIPGNFCNTIFAGDFDNANPDEGPSVDIVYGDFNAFDYFGSVSIRLNVRGFLDQDNLYPQADLVITNPFEANDLNFGGYNLQAIGDFNGDGFPDLLIGVTSKGYAVVVY